MVWWLVAVRFRKMWSVGLGSVLTGLEFVAGRERKWMSAMPAMWFVDQVGLEKEVCNAVQRSQC